MKTQIKALWKGMIPVRDVYVNVALMKGEDLIVDVKKTKESFVISNEQLKTPYIDRAVRDNFSPKMQRLLYYTVVKAKENDGQMKLL
jgi:hypothetical protein